MIGSYESTIKDEFVETWGMMLPSGVPTDAMKLLDFAYFGEEERQTINFLDPLSLTNEAIRLFERLFRIKKKVFHEIMTLYQKCHAVHWYNSERLPQNTPSQSLE